MIFTICANLGIVIEGMCLHTQINHSSSYVVIVEIVDLPFACSPSLLSQRTSSLPCATPRANPPSLTPLTLFSGSQSFTLIEGGSHFLGEGEFGRLRGDSHRLPPPPPRLLGVAAAWELWGRPCYFRVLFVWVFTKNANFNLLVPEADQTGEPSWRHCWITIFTFTRHKYHFSDFLPRNVLFSLYWLLMWELTSLDLTWTVTERPLDLEQL